MSMTDWAEQECRIACKKENPDFNFDSEDFDYGCSCYKSALKAYKSLCEDGHSGASWGFTKRILERLMSGQPLTPITDDDFFINNIDRVPSLGGDKWLEERGLKSDIQCPRMSSLFREERLDGTVTYHDNERYYYRNIENPSDTYNSGAEFLDKMFPITMPYSPRRDKYEIFAQTFLTDERNGDFDTKGILYMITPEGNRVDLNIYKTEKNGKFVDISKEEYEELLEKRIDKLRFKVADSLLWTLTSNSASDAEIERREKAWRGLLPETKNSLRKTLEDKCVFFEKPENYKYNSFHTKQDLCAGDFSDFKDVPELVEIGEFLQGVLKIIAE